MRRAAGRVDNWDELSIEQFGFRQSDFPTVGNWNQYASSHIGAAMLDSQLGRDLWRHARVKREVFREGSAAVIWLV